MARGKRTIQEIVSINQNIERDLWIKIHNEGISLKEVEGISFLGSGKLKPQKPKWPCVY